MKRTAHEKFKRTMIRIAAGVAAIAASAQAHAQTAAPAYSAKTPPSIQTPDTVQTRIGPLKFFDGAPDPDTAKLVYDQLDLGRGVEAFMAGMPAASVYAFCDGAEKAGAKPNQGIAITEGLMDARSLFLTPNTTTIYVLACLDLSKGPVVLEAAAHRLRTEALLRPWADFVAKRVQ